MSTIRLSGHVNEQHQLTVDVPPSIPPGPVSVLIVPMEQEIVSEDAWEQFVAHEWQDDLSDVRQDIYSLDDGVPVHES